MISFIADGSAVGRGWIRKQSTCQRSVGSSGDQRFDLKASLFTPHRSLRSRENQGSNGAMAAVPTPRLSGPANSLHQISIRNQFQQSGLEGR